MPVAFQVGQLHSMTVAVSEDDVRQFIALSGDNAPIHRDPDFARRAGFDGPIVHGALLIALVSRLVGNEFPGPAAILERVDIAFRKPCYAPTTLSLTARVRQVSDAVASLVLEIAVAGATGEILATGKSWHRILDLK